jgi:hypothetical protein
MIFDYDGERLAWMFNLNHISSSYLEYEVRPLDKLINLYVQPKPHLLLLPPI